MASLHEASAQSSILAQQAAIAARPASTEHRMADAVRALAIDAVEAAQSGHPGLPIGMADVATALWVRFLKFDAADPHWPDRDRFVISPGHGATLLFALLRLTGHAGRGIEPPRRPEQAHSPAAGHLEYGDYPPGEATAGPFGQGFAAAVGMALAERLLTARFGKSLVDHRTWVIASDGDLMEGISHEAASLAGHLRLEKLAVLYDDSGVSGDGEGPPACSDNALKRFAAYGWAVRRIDGHDPAQVTAALSYAVRSKKPTLIACGTVAGLAAARPAGTALARGGRPGAEAALEVKQALGWDHPPFTIPDGLRARWSAAGARGASSRRAWLKRAARHPLRAEFERVMAGRLPDTWHEACAALKAEIGDGRPELATRQASEVVLAALVSAVPELIGGAADATGGHLTLVKGMGSVAAGNYRGRTIHYGAREHAMAAALNGMALHGGIIPFAGTFLAFSDCLRPALRLAALMGRRAIHVLTEGDSALGDGSAAHMPVEQLASLRAIPNLHVIRPADAMETAECWELALRRADGPSVLVLTRQPVPALRTDAAQNRSALGGYVLAEAEGPRQATLIASGAEVSIALAARAALAGAGVAAAVVSLPCWELFARQDAGYRASVLGGVPRFGIEAGTGFGWERWLGDDGSFIGMSGFGGAAPYEEHYQHFRITPEAVTAEVTKRLRRE